MSIPVHPKAILMARIMLGRNETLSDEDAVQRKAEEIQADWNEAAKERETVLRDQLAMAAPVDEVCMLVSAETYGTDIREIVLARYKWADAMLQARGTK